jgi:hypothetical protein
MSAKRKEAKKVKVKLAAIRNQRKIAMQTVESKREVNKAMQQCNPKASPAAIALQRELSRSKQGMFINGEL